MQYNNSSEIPQKEGTQKVIQGIDSGYHDGTCMIIYISSIASPTTVYTILTNLILKCDKSKATRSPGFAVHHDNGINHSSKLFEEGMKLLQSYCVFRQGHGGRGGLKLVSESCMRSERDSKYYRLVYYLCQPL
jgi:hypothetical protein